MADTPRPLPDLQALLADNDEGEISPQDMRDVLVSVHLPVENVRAHGAVGDGVTNDTAAIQAALDAADPGTAVLVPPGTYAVDTVRVPSYVTLLGSGWASVLRARGAGPVVTNDPTAGNPTTHLFQIRDLRIAGTAASGGIGVELLGAQRFTIDRVLIDGFTGADAYAMRFSKYDDGGTLRNTVDGDVYNIQIRDCTNGIITTKPAGDAQTFGASFIRFHGGDVRGYTGYGFNLDHGEGVTCFGTRFATGAGGSTGVRVNDDGNAFYNCAADCSAAKPNGATGFRVEAGASDNHISNPIGDGPDNRVVNLGNNTIVFRQAFMSMPSISIAGPGAPLPFAQTGAIRLPNGQNVNARNAADDGDITIFGLSSGDVVNLAQAGITTRANGNFLAQGNITGQQNLIIGSSPATAGGILRLPNNQNIVARNAGGSANIPLLRLTNADRVALDPDGAGVVLNVPTSDPGVAGMLWNDGTYLRVSAGA